jgi:hypothetical protein
MLPQALSDLFQPIREPETGPMLRRILIRALAAGILSASAAPAFASAFDFVPAPQTDLNRVYRIDKVTGAVSSCQYGLKEGTVGITLCFGPGEGAKAQDPGDYGLIASRHEREGGVFRVNYRTGEMSVCYVFEEQVVCTPPETVTATVAEGEGDRPQVTGSTSD